MPRLDIQKDTLLLHELSTYCTANRIIINYEKCCYIEFTCGNSNSTPYMAKYNLFIAGNSISNVDKCKFLGVMINSNLKWDDQMLHVKKLLSQAIGALNSIKSYVPQKVLRTVYFALVQPYLVYALPLWGTQHKTELFCAVAKKSYANYNE